MDSDVNHLIRQLRSGDDETMDAAAGILCREKIKEVIPLLIALTYHHNSIVRGVSALCLGVFGDERSERYLVRLKTLDRDKNVRLAAFLSLKHRGKISYENIKSEMRSYVKFSIKEIFPHRCEPAQGGKHPSIFSRIPVLGLFPIYTRPVQISIIGGCIIVFGLFFSAMFWGEFHFQSTNKFLEKSDKPSLGSLLALRNKEIASFRNQCLNPEIPESKLPKTITLTTYGDVLKDIVEQAYDDPHLAKTGKNTLLSSWRKINYGTSSKDTTESLWYETSRNEQLIFPNLPAMHLEYELSRSTVAYEAIEQPDPDVEIVVTVEKEMSGHEFTLTLTLRNHGYSLKKLSLKKGCILEMAGLDSMQYQSIFIIRGDGLIIIPPRQTVQRMIKGLGMHKGFALPPKGAHLQFTPFVIKEGLLDRPPEEFYKMMGSPEPNILRVTAQGYSSRENGKNERGRDEAFRNALVMAAQQSGVEITNDIINQNLSFIRDHQRLYTQKHSVRLIKIIHEEYRKEENKYLLIGEFEVQTPAPQPIVRTN